MVNADYYAINPIRQTNTAIMIKCINSNLPSRSELVKHKKHIYIIVYVEKIYDGTYDARGELYNGLYK